MNLILSLIATVNWAISIFVQLASRFIKISFNPNILVRLWGENILMPLNHALPLYSFLYKDYSKNLERISAYLSIKNADFGVVDVGSNIGDSVVLIKKHGDTSILCIEGNDLYLDILKKNVEKYPNVFIAPYFVGDKVERIKADITNDSGTSALAKSNKNNNIINIKTLDYLVHKYKFDDVKLIKIDTDGFDGKVLRGSVNTMKTFNPVLYFEFDERFYVNCGETFMGVLEFLIDNQYQLVVIYDNFGKLISGLELPNRIDESFIDNIFRRSKAAVYYDLIVFKNLNKSMYKEFLEREKQYFINK